MANLGLPQIIIRFKQLASSIINRSKKGVVCIGIKDDTDKLFTVKIYTDVVALMADKNLYTAGNYNALMDTFLGSPAKVIVCRVDIAGKVANVLALATALTFNYFAFIGATPADHNSIVVWAKAQNEVRSKRIKVVTFGATVSDYEHCINFTNTTVKRKADATAIEGYLYLGRIAGLLAGLPFTQSCTYLKLTDLESVVEPADVNAAIGLGQFVIINDEGNPRIGRGVNSLQTLSLGITDQFKKITIIEALDLMSEDIKSTFKDDYCGKFKNTFSSQILFISAVNGYFSELAKEQVLDKEYQNVAKIDVNAMRAKWDELGKDVSALDDEKVMKLTIESDVYVAGDIKILDATENLGFDLSMA